MVKETKFRHHPVRIEKSLYLGTQQLDIVGVQLVFLDEALAEDLTGLATTGWIPTNFDSWDVLTTAGYTVPTNAIAVILDVEVNDSGVGAYSMALASVEPDANTSNQAVPAGKTQTVYVGQVGDRKGARIIIVELSQDSSIRTKITSSGDLDYSIKLIGFLIGGTDVSRPTWPSVDLYCKFICRQA